MSNCKVLPRRYTKIMVLYLQLVITNRGGYMLKRKDKIIISAIELLGEKGIAGITTKNLAKRQKVSEPALYRQFSGKQEILNFIIDEYASFDVQIQDTIDQSNLAGKEALLFYIDRYAELYENYVELTTIMLSMDLYYYNDYTRSKMDIIINSRKTYIRKLIEKNQLNFGNYKNIDAEELATIIEGIFYSTILKWRLRDQTYSLKEKINTMCSNLVH